MAAASLIHHTDVRPSRPVTPDLGPEALVARLRPERIAAQDLAKDIIEAERGVEVEVTVRTGPDTNHAGRKEKVIDAVASRLQRRIVDFEFAAVPQMHARLVAQLNLDAGVS